MDLTPATREEMAQVLRGATADRRVVDVRGGGLHAHRGWPFTPDDVIHTGGLCLATLPVTGIRTGGLCMATLPVAGLHTCRFHLATLPVESLHTGRLHLAELSFRHFCLYANKFDIKRLAIF